MAAKKKTAKLSFAKVVRRVMSEQLPAYRFLATTGGSGPLVTFERPNRLAKKGLRETVMFDKNDYYDCTRCKAFVRRAPARLEKRAVPGFGTHFALVCSKH